MKIRRLDFLGSAVAEDQFPPADLPEIALAGRSNVGKSSLLNMLLNRNNFARTSSTPGKTQTINFYEINQQFRFVDLPGYGYAKVAKAKKATWAAFINRYLESRSNLIDIWLLVDARHEPTRDDQMMYRYIVEHGFSGTVILTKTDKLKQSELARSIKRIKQILGTDSRVVLTTSASKAKGKYPTWDYLNQLFASHGLDITMERQQEAK